MFSAAVNAPRARTASLLLCAALVCAGPACRRAQDGATRRTAPDSGISEFTPKVPKTCAELTCDAPAECKVEGSRARCVCPTGYAELKDAPGQCEDVDECATNTHDCDTNASCKKRVGSFDCMCNEGFAGTGRICNSLNDCGGAANTCHADAQCTPSATGSGVDCACSPGFEGDGHLCKDIDECEQGTGACAEHAHCVNLRSSFDCNCDQGYEGDGKNYCQDLCDKAQEDPSRCDFRRNGRCAFQPDGSARCTSCDSDSVGNGVNCTASGECSNLGCGENTQCVGEAGTRRCECAPGFTGNPQTGCSDIDECAAGMDICDARTSECVNRQGGYFCACLSGLQRNMNSGECELVNECTRGLDLCDSGANCIDLPSGYNCQCKPGYEGDGYSCEDIDECQTDGADCVKDGVASCQNTRGGYECQCPKGYAGDGKRENCYCDFSGVWGVRQKGVLELPKRAAGSTVIIQESITRATIWEIHRFEYDGATLRVQRKQCGSDLAAEIFSPLYTETYSSFVPNNVYEAIGFKPGRDMNLPSNAALPGKPFVTPRDAIVQGVKLNDPLNDPWPASRTDIPASAWEDTDNDGEPGITLWPANTTAETRNGKGTYSYLPVELGGDSTRIETRTGCVSTAVRVIGHLEGTINSCARLTGKVVNDKTEGRVYSCAVLRTADWDKLDVTCNKQDWASARRCTPEQADFLDDQDQTSRSEADFEMVKLGDLNAMDIDCEAVRKALP